MTFIEQQDRPMSLKHAAELFGIGVATLRAERNRGRLHIFRIGRQDMTTIADMREMVERCRDAAKVPAYTSISREVRRGNTPYETAAASLDSAEQTLLKLRSDFRNTLRGSTSPRQARVR